MTWPSAVRTQPPPPKKKSCRESVNPSVAEIQMIPLQNKNKNKLENVFMKHYAPNYMLASEQNIHVSDVTEKGDNSVIHQQNFTKS